MKRMFIAFLTVAAAVIAFGASSAFAAGLNYNAGTGELTYFTNDAGDSPYLDNKVNIKPVSVGGWSGFSINDRAWTYSWDKNGYILGVNLFLNPDAFKYCVFDRQGYNFGTLDEWWCPATKIVVKTGAGNDDVEVSQNVKIPTVLEGGAGLDWLQGGGGNDVIWGGSSSGDAASNSHKDTLKGGPGNDALHGGIADDYLDGEAGNDLLDGGLGADTLNGGPDTDYADYSSHTAPIVASLDGTRNDGQAGEFDLIAADVEGIEGGSGNDSLSGNDSANVLMGGAGDDYLDARGGDDQLWGGTGSDLLRPGVGKDVVYGGSEPAGSCCKYDTVTYGERWNPVNVSLDGVANDGEAGESDNVAPDVENVTGGSSNDTLTGNKYANTLTGGPGTDSLDGKGGGGLFEEPALGHPDTLSGGPGNDVLSGGPVSNNRDIIDGGADTDMVTYASRTAGVNIFLDGSPNGEDTITNVENATGGAGDDTIGGNAVFNVLIGNAGNDKLWGEAGNDYLQGKAGNDYLDGGAGNDNLSGDDGADTLNGGPGADYLSGWTGVDTASYQSSVVPVTVKLDGTANDGAAGEGDNVLPDIETIVGGSAADTIIGTVAAETLFGGAGPDSLYGMGGNDTLGGGAGADILHGGDGIDTLDGGIDNDKLYGEAGVDTLRGGLGTNLLDGGADADYADYSAATSAVAVNLTAKAAAGVGISDTLVAIENVNGSNFNDALTGDAGPNTVKGFAGNDTIVGWAGNDHLFGADGNDTLRGETGDDELNGGPGTDTADYSTATGPVTVNLSSYNATATGAAGNDWLMLIENVTGSASGDTITGSADANVLLGGAGNDKLFGLGGNDKLDGQVGVDSVDGGINIDTCLAETKVSCEL
jgi:Ca2+-binding RTX toxin-like protein